MQTLPILAVHLATHPQSITIKLSSSDIHQYYPKQDMAEYTAEQLTDLLATVNHRPNDIQAICTTVGPGSYTGIKLGITLTKTLAQIFQKPVIGISTLEALALAYRPFNGLYICVHPARASLYHTALFGIYNADIKRLSTDFTRTNTQLFQTLKAFKEPVFLIGQLRDSDLEQLDHCPLVTYIPSSVKGEHLIQYAENKLEKSSQYPYKKIQPHYAFEPLT